MKTGWWLTLALVGAVLALVMLCGCGGGTNGGGNAVPLGANHLYAAGDQWVYRVTGTYVPAGLPAIAFGPAVATLDYDDTILPLAVNTHQFKLSADFPVGSHHTEEFRQAIAFTQDGNGVVTIHGLTPHLDPSMPVEALTPPVGGLSLSGIPTTGHYAVNSTMPTLGNLTGSGDFVANEDVSTAVGTFATSRLAGSGTLDAFTVNITAWLNPQVGAFVKLRVQWTEGDGSTMDMTFQLTSTTVAYVP